MQIYCRISRIHTIMKINFRPLFLARKAFGMRVRSTYSRTAAYIIITVRSSDNVRRSINENEWAAYGVRDDCGFETRLSFPSSSQWRKCIYNYFCFRITIVVDAGGPWGSLVAGSLIMNRAPGSPFHHIMHVNVIPFSIVWRCRLHLKIHSPFSSLHCGARGREGFNRSRDTFAMSHIRFERRKKNRT